MKKLLLGALLATTMVGGMQAAGDYDPEKINFYDKLIMEWVLFSFTHASVKSVSPAMMVRFSQLMDEIDAYAAAKTGMPTHDYYKKHVDRDKYEGWPSVEEIKQALKELLPKKLAITDGTEQEETPDIVMEVSASVMKNIIEAVQEEKTEEKEEFVSDELTKNT